MTRGKAIQLLQNQEFDLLVIGGGITGAGIALDAQSRGMSVALIEKQDFASGTSSKSTKLIHGGLRYLKQLKLRMVAKVGRERAILHQNAPHLVHPEGMLLPIKKDGSLGWTSTRFALWIYDRLAGVRGDHKFRMLSLRKAREQEPLLGKEIQGAGLYSEFRTDDARLVMSVILTAQAQGAIVVNYVECIDVITKNEEISGVVARDVESENELLIKAKQIVNATGPWVDKVRELEQGVVSKKLKLTKGVHLVVDFGKLPIKQSIYFDATDGRMIFAIPRLGKVYLGTTDTFYSNEKDDVTANLRDVEYLLSQVNQAFGQANLKTSDVESSWAGLRPLIREDGKEPGQLSRKDELYISPTGLISIAGGKLTGYRLMAKRVTDLVIKNRGRGKVPCVTSDLTLKGGDFADYKTFLDFVRNTSELNRLTYSSGLYLCQNYGTKTLNLLTKYYTSTGDEDLDVLLAEASYCVDNEYVISVLDFFERRTGRLYFDIHSVEKHANAIIQHLGQRLGWSSSRKSHEEAILKARIDQVNSFS